VFRPATVEVDVLPPVDTSDWSFRTIDEHVREVRNMFLRTLGQPEEPAADSRRRSVHRAGPRARKSDAPKRRKPRAKTAPGRRQNKGFRGENGAQGRGLARRSPPRRPKKPKPGAAKTSAPAKRKAKARKTTQGLR
jgi:putative phosphoserine phosphatase/1-acylglycerol-3-phosphate O-acyltransferase